jgi:hypothetical protein
MDWYKGSGDLEYDADACLLLKAQDDNNGANGNGNSGNANGGGTRIPVELHLVKNRYGTLTFDHPIILNFDRRYGSFTERQTAGGIPPPPSPSGVPVR